MKLKKNFMIGVVILFIYSIVTFCLLLVADRVERLEKEDFRNTNSSFVIRLGK